MRGSSSLFMYILVTYSCHKKLCHSHSFILLLLPGIVFWWTGKSYFHIFLQLQLYACVNGIGFTNIICRMLSTFKSCLLEINSNDGLKWDHLESFSSTTKNKGPLQQYLYPPNLAWWCLTIRDFHQSTHVTLWSRSLLNDVTN